MGYVDLITITHLTPSSSVNDEIAPSTIKTISFLVRCCDHIWKAHLCMNKCMIDMPGELNASLVCQWQER